MQSPSGNGSDKADKEENDSISSSFGDNREKLASQDSIDISSSSSSENESPEPHNEVDQQNGDDASKQLVLYDPGENNGEIIPSTTPFRSCLTLNGPPRVLPSIGAFTVQCANCFKWRLIPTKEKYEEIREHILEQPFYCETARQWRPDLKCDDPTDISQDGNRLWAIDKPNIAQPPPGWQRLLRIRGEGSTKFADVWLMEHPEYLREGVTLSQFSFQIPKPLRENYVRKRTPRVSTSNENVRSLESREEQPLALEGPDNSLDLQLGTPGFSTPNHFETDPSDRPKKKQARRSE
ncbi:hypothetical protein ACFE04_027010 [Oxalis oulophora]